MPKPRKQLISLDATPYYHCVSRCVRRAFLCGIDTVTGQSYEHRRQWIEDRIHLLGNIFCIDVCAYAVMSNHVHTVLFINKKEIETLTNIEICQRWHSLFSGNILSKKFIKTEPLTDAELQKLNEIIAIWRERLCDIAWFMRCLNEPIAREANKEDNCTGHFWEGRYKSQALLDDAALAACMAYVDLNPIRASMAESPEKSAHTSIKYRIETLEKSTDNQPQQPTSLAQFIGNPRNNMPQGLPFKLDDYLTLVDWTGRIIRDDKRGAISQHLPSILSRLNIKPKQWHQLTTKFESHFKHRVGKAETLKQYMANFQLKRCTGLSQSRALLE